jgi:hypothetical protein
MLVELGDVPPSMPCRPMSPLCRPGLYAKVDVHHWQFGGRR